MNKFLAILTIFVAQGALAGTCVINTTEGFFYEAPVRLEPVSTFSVGVQDCQRKGQQTANFVAATNAQGALEVSSTATFFYENGAVSPTFTFVGNYFSYDRAMESEYAFLLGSIAYAGLYGGYYYHTYGGYPVGEIYRRPEVVVRISEHNTRIVNHTTIVRNKVQVNERTTERRVEEPRREEPRREEPRREGRR